MTAASGDRRGFTLTELMVSLVMFGVVSGIVLGMVRGQQRFYRGATEVIDVRSQLRQAAAVLPLELRSISTVSNVVPAGSPYQPSILGSDITAMTDSSIQFRATIGSGVVCKRVGQVLTLVPTGVLKNGAVLTSWYAPPRDNDTVFVFDPGSDDGAANDQWRPYRISGTSTNAVNQCGGSPLITTGTGAAGDDDKPQAQFTITEVAGVGYPASITAGSVVRITRTVKYSLYKGGDGKWYLGYRTVEPNGQLQASVDPIGGPYRDYAAGSTTNGLAFTYFDSLGAVTNQPDRVARVNITLRGAGTERRNAANWSATKNNQVFLDSLLLRVAIRNRY